MQKKLQYDEQIKQFIQELKAREDTHVDTRVLDYSGNRCAACAKDMKVLFGIVQGVATIGIFNPKGTNFLIPYTVCRQCALAVQKSGNLNREMLKSIEDTVVLTIPEVADLI